MTEQVNLREAVQLRNALIKRRDEKYLNMIYALNIQCAEILKDDLGSQFVMSCGRDLAGEVVRNFFNTSDFNITVDQLAERILKFEYSNEYDPLRDNAQVHKNVYNYNEVIPSDRIKLIVKDMDESQEKLFKKEPNEKGKMKYSKEDSYIIDKGKDKYRQEKRAKDGNLRDELTGAEGRIEVDHIVATATAKYNVRYIKANGVSELKYSNNSGDNFQMMLKNANGSKGDVKVLDKYKNDITHRATPEQYADAIAKRWEGINPGDKKKREASLKLLKEKGYLNEDGKVPKDVKNRLIRNIRNSQNAESKVILKNADYNEIGKDAFGHTKASIGKIVAGQIIYYVTPPLVYEMRGIIRNKPSSLDDALERLKEAGKRIGKYVLRNLKHIFTNIAVSSLKNFIKIFLDILINMVKATVKKILKLVKNLVLSTVDAVRIIARKDSSAAQKADAVSNLFGVTITTFAVDALFEVLERGLHIPEELLAPLQILTTVVCTNLTILILQKADLFDVRFGYKVYAIRSLFENTADDFAAEMQLADNAASNEINAIIERAKDKCYEIYQNLIYLDPHDTDIRGDLVKLNALFGTGVQFREV